MLRPFAILSLFNTIIIVLLGEFIFVEDRKNPLNRLYAVFSFIFAGWAFCEFMVRSASTFEVAATWNRIVALFWPFSTPIFLHLVLMFTEKNELLKKKWIYFVLYLPATVTSITDLTTDIISTDPVLKYWGWTYLVPQNNAPYFLAVGWLFTLGLTALIVTFHFYLTTQNPIKKSQAKLLTVGFAFPVFSAFITEVLLPALSIRIPELMTTFLTGMVVVFAYAIAKYELFILNPATAAENIVSTMTDSLIIINPDMQILSINQASSNILGYSTKELHGQNASIVFANKPKIKELFRKIVDDKTSCKNYETTYLTKTGVDIPILLSCSPIFSKRKKLVGVVCIAKDITDRPIEKKLK